MMKQTFKKPGLRPQQLALLLAVGAALFSAEANAIGRAPTTTVTTVSRAGGLRTPITVVRPAVILPPRPTIVVPPCFRGGKAGASPC